VRVRFSDDQTDKLNLIASLENVTPEKWLRTHALRAIRLATFVEVHAVSKHCWTATASGIEPVTRPLLQRRRRP
jgi:hypothetical protein